MAKKNDPINVYGTEIINMISKNVDVPKTIVNKVINELFTQVGKALYSNKKNGGSVKFSGWGVFTTSYTKERKMKNHLATAGKKSKEILIPAGYTIRYRSGSKLKSLVKTGKLPKAAPRTGRTPSKKKSKKK